MSDKEQNQNDYSDNQSENTNSENTNSEESSDSDLLNTLLQKLLNLLLDIRIYHWKTLETNLELHGHLDEIKGFLLNTIDKFAEKIIILGGQVEIENVKSGTLEEEPQTIKDDCIDKINEMIDFIKSEWDTDLVKKELVIQQNMIDLVESLQLYNVKLKGVTIV